MLGLRPRARVAALPAVSARAAAGLRAGMEGGMRRDPSLASAILMWVGGMAVSAGAAWQWADDPGLTVALIGLALLILSVLQRLYDDSGDRS